MANKRTNPTINNTKKPFVLRDENHLKISLGIIISVFAFILYAQSVFFDYTIDDVYVLKGNTLTKEGIKSIPQILKTDYLFGFKDIERGPIYRPASMIMFAIEWNFFPDNPHVYHLINVLLFALTGFLLYLLLCYLFKNQNVFFPFVCSLLYVAHPIHTEVINNIKSRDEILCFLFGILAITMFVKYISTPSLRYIITGSISFFISMLSKETGVTFLIIIPLTIYVFSDVSLRKFLIVSFVLITVSGIYFLIRLHVLKNVGTNTTIPYLYNSVLAAPTLISRQFTVFYILLKYLQLLILPYSLTCDYNYSMIAVQTFKDLPALVGILINLSIGIYALITLRKKSIIAYGILFYFITLSPVSNMFIDNGATLAERFLYTPSLGFCILLTYLIFRFTKTEIMQNKLQKLVPNRTLYTVVVIVIGLYSIKTVARSMDWKDSYTIFSHDAETSANSATIHYLLGYEIFANIYPKEKDKSEKIKLLDKAIIELTKATTIYAKYKDAYLCLAYCYEKKEAYPDALKNYETAARISDSKDAILLCDIGGLYSKLGQFDKALLFLDSALLYKPNSSDIHNNKGSVLSSLQRYDSAIIEFDKAIELDEKNAQALKNLGSTYANLKQYTKALNAYKKSMEYDTTIFESYYFTGMIYQILGDTATAKSFLEKAQSLRN